MGTRADFYVGQGLDAEWLGSIAWDGYPDGAPRHVITATSEADWRTRVDKLLKKDDGTTPADGWPWPWEDSRTTDYAYAWTPEGVRASCFGHAWFDPSAPEPELPEEEAKVAIFPDMRAKQKVVTRGPRSGLIILGG